MDNTENNRLLFEYEDNWNTDVGAFIPKVGVFFRGKDLLSELKDMSWIHLYLYGITGRTFSDAQVHLFERMWVLCASYPDPRIWVNRVAALAGTTRSSSIIGVGAATAVFEAEIYGGGAIIGAIDFIKRARDKIQNNVSLNSVVEDELKLHRVIPGFGRPIADEDERIAPVSEFAESLGLANGEHHLLVKSVEEALKKIYGPWAFKMNIAALIAALAADQGLSKNEFHSFMSFSSSIGIAACFKDASEKPEGLFFPLRCRRIKYEGRPPRKFHKEEG